jgi:hypothetical protein
MGCHARGLVPSPVSGDARLIVDAAIIIYYSCGALPGILDDDVGQRFPAAAWGRMELGCPAVDDVLGGDAAQLLSGVHDSVGHYLQRS